MDELTAIAENLRRQRRDLDESIEGTSSRSSEAAELVDKIDQLRRRAEETTRRFDATQTRTGSRGNK